jgi:hypothetical protein
MGDRDDQLRDLLDRGYELAASRLEGINEAALELADAAGDDRRVMERAIRVVAERVRVDPSHANKQVAPPLRRAIELGMCGGTGMTPGTCRDNDVPPWGSGSHRASLDGRSSGLE